MSVAAHAIPKYFAGPSRSGRPVKALRDTTKKVLILVMRGEEVKGIGERVRLSERSVRNRINYARYLLSAKTKEQLIFQALSNGFVTFDEVLGDHIIPRVLA